MKEPVPEYQNRTAVVSCSSGFEKIRSSGWVLIDSRQAIYRPIVGIQCAGLIVAFVVAYPADISFNLAAGFGDDLDVSVNDILVIADAPGIEGLVRKNDGQIVVIKFIFYVPVAMSKRQVGQFVGDGVLAACIFGVDQKEIRADHFINERHEKLALKNDQPDKADEKKRYGEFAFHKNYIVIVVKDEIRRDFSRNQDLLRAVINDTKKRCVKVNARAFLS
jgi:hypothetical protein